MLSRVLAVTAFVLLAPLLAGQNPAPKTELLPQLDKSKPPENRPAKAPEREKIDPKKYPRPTLEKYLADHMEPWRKALQPAVVPGNPKAMVAAQTNKDWWSKTATLTYESVAGAGGKKLAEGWATATWNTTGKPFAEGTFRQDQMHGVWRFFNDKGELESVRAYTSGYCEGPYVTVDASGVTSHGIYKASSRHGEWLHFFATGQLYLRVQWVPTKAATFIKWQREYNKAGELVRHTVYRGEGEGSDLTAWVEPKLDEKGNVTNRATVGRLELLSRDAKGKTHGWQTFYHNKEGYRLHDTWYEASVQTGPYMEYDAMGKQVEGGTKKEGKIVGPWWRIRADGSREEVTYDDTSSWHGPYSDTRPDGTVWAKGRYEKGLKAGAWQESGGVGDYISGNIAFVLSACQLSGLTITGSYRDGQRDGPWVFRRKDETLALEVPFVKGAAHGEARFYFPDGKQIAASGSFASAWQTGNWVYYHKSGAKSAEGGHAIGAKDGPWKSWSESGNLSSEGTYKDDRRTGPWVYYWPNGKPRERGTYVIDFQKSWAYEKPVGEWDSFDEEGELVHRYVYATISPYDLQGSLEREAKLANPPEGVVINKELPNGTFATYRGSGVTKLLVSRMVAVNGKPHGKAQQFYPNGKVGAEGDIFGDKREGTWKYWYDTGVQKEEATFFDGNPKGPYKSWRPDGTLQNEGEYTGTQKTGRWLTYFLDGKQVQRDVTYGDAEKLDGPMVEYHPDGKLARKGAYVAGKETGTWESFYPDGTKRFVVNYVEGKLDGLYQSWHANGKMSLEQSYARGTLEGQYRTWHENGQLKGEGVYKGGTAVGLWKSWYENGKQSHHKEFDETGKPKGKWTEWNEDGSVKSETDHG